jgi:transposase
MRGDKKQTPVIAIVQRRGKVLAKAVPDVTEPTLSGIIRKHVAPESVIYTDEFSSYGRIPYLRDENGKPLGYRHRHIKHSAGQYVYKDIHTNSVEGLWSLIKRGINGVYHSVSPRYLQAYLDEYTFRYNRRYMGNRQFRSILERASRQESRRPY